MRAARSMPPRLSAPQSAEARESSHAAMILRRRD